MLHTVGALHPMFGGPSFSVPALCKSVASRGAAVTIAFQRIGVNQTKDDGINYAPINGIYLPRARMALPWRPTASIGCFAKKMSANLIHDHGMWLPINGAAANVARTRGVPYICSPRGTLTAWAMKHKQLKKRLGMALYQRRNLELVRLFVATSHSEAEDLRRIGMRQPIAIIPNGVEVPSRLVRDSSTTIRTLLFMSRLHPKKGLIALVRAWSIARPKGWQVVIAGPDEEGHRAVVEAEISRHGLSADFSFVGEVAGSEKDALWRRANLFVLPSYSENFGNVVAESLAHGVPVITTTGTPWIDLPTQNCGWCVQPDVDSLATALTHSTSMNDDALATMGANGRQYVQRGYSWDAAGQSTLDVYRWLLGKGPMPSSVLLR